MLKEIAKIMSITMFNLLIWAIIGGFALRFTTMMEDPFMRFSWWAVLIGCAVIGVSMVVRILFSEEDLFEEED